MMFAARARYGKSRINWRTRERTMGEEAPMMSLTFVLASDQAPVIRLVLAAAYISARCIGDKPIR